MLANLHQALRPGGHLYLTLEEIAAGDVAAGFDDAWARGLPVVPGGVVEGDTAGYHYYPGRRQALSWLAAEGFVVVDEAVSHHDGWDYRHLLVRDAAGRSGDEVALDHRAGRR